MPWNVIQHINMQLKNIFKLWDIWMDSLYPYERCSISLHPNNAFWEFEVVLSDSENTIVFDWFSYIRKSGVYQWQSWFGVLCSSEKFASAYRNIQSRRKKSKIFSYQCSSVLLNILVLQNHKTRNLESRIQVLGNHLICAKLFAHFYKNT